MAYEVDNRIFRVVVDQWGHYSICPLDSEILSGWRDVGKTGTRDECFEYIGQVMDGRGAVTSAS